MGSCQTCVEVHTLCGYDRLKQFWFHTSDAAHNLDNTVLEGRRNDKLLHKGTGEMGELGLKIQVFD